MSDVVSWGAPLPRGDDVERATDSGILVPEPEGKEHPIVVAQTTVTGLQYNFVGPEQRHLEEIAAAIHEAQRRLAAGEWIEQLWLREPQFGEDVFLSSVGISHIIGVVRGFAARIDPVAQQRQLQEHARLEQRLAGLTAAGRRS